MSGFRQLLRLLLTAWCFLGVVASSAQAQPFSEEQLKAALIYRAAKFVRWPEHSFSEAAPQMDFCVHPQSGLLDAVRELEGKSVNSRAIVVRSVAADPAGYQGCHVVILGGSGVSQLQLVEGAAALTVSDQAAFVESGGIMALQLVDTRVQLVINPDNAARNNLRINSQLLELSRIVRNTDEGTG